MSNRQRFPVEMSNDDKENYLTKYQKCDANFFLLQAKGKRLAKLKKNNVVALQ